MKTFKLCYIVRYGKSATAFFTTNELKNQWGDDWNDAPYEHNAGDPYTWREYMGERGIPEYEIKSVDFFYDGFVFPCDDGHYNSPWSVDDINAGRVPWVRLVGVSIEDFRIMAGTELNDFCDAIEKYGGFVRPGSRISTNG